LFIFTLLNGIYNKKFTIINKRNNNLLIVLESSSLINGYYEAGVSLTVECFAILLFGGAACVSNLHPESGYPGRRFYTFFFYR
jgi:hypothetical protein